MNDKEPRTNKTIQYIPEDHLPISTIFFSIVENQAPRHKFLKSTGYRVEKEKTRYDFNTCVYEFKNRLSFKIIIKSLKTTHQLANEFHDIYLHYT